MDWLRKNRFGTTSSSSPDDPGRRRDARQDLARPPDPPDRPVYAKYLRKLIASRRPPRYLFQFAFKCVMHTHFATMTRQMARGESRLVNT